jgi:hypothetical protein
VLVKAGPHQGVAGNGLGISGDLFEGVIELGVSRPLGINALPSGSPFELELVFEGGLKLGDSARSDVLARHSAVAPDRSLQPCPAVSVDECH